ncbi:MAG: hypothetical protein ACI8WB_004696 [Phenylobacterium sp.]
MKIRRLSLIKLILIQLNLIQLNLIKPLISILLISGFLTFTTQAAPTCNPLFFRDTIATEPLWADFTYLSSDALQGRKTGSKGSRKAQQYLQLAFNQIGVKAFHPDHRQPFRRTKTSSDFLGTNMVGWLPGSTLADEYIVIAAHYDHLGREGLKIFNGADDNASGVAALLAIARVIKAKPLRHSVIFVATDAEETGLYGAKAFLRQPPVAIKSIKYAINLDMIAQAGKKRRLYLAGGKAFKQLKDVIAQSVNQASLCLLAGHDSSGYSYDRKYRIDWARASDHYAFTEQGIANLFFSVGDHKYYHTERDTIATINKEFYFAAVETVLTSLGLLDGMSEFAQEVATAK